MVQYSSDLRLHRHIGCLKMPQNEEQTFAMVEAMGESIYTARSWPQNSAQNVAFFPYLLSITMPIGFSFPESSRHYISSEKQRSEFAVWEVKNPRTLHQQKTAKRFLIQYKYCSLVWIFFLHIGCLPWQEKYCPLITYDLPVTNTTLHDFNFSSVSKKP